MGAVHVLRSIRKIATWPVILWILLGGKPKWLPLNFGFNDVMRTAPIAQKTDLTFHPQHPHCQLFIHTPPPTPTLPIDILPNYDQGTSKQAAQNRQLWATQSFSIVISKTFDIHQIDVLLQLKYLFAVLVIFKMASTDHFFGSICSQVDLTMILVGFSGVIVFRRLELLYWDFEKV